VAEAWAALHAIIFVKKIWMFDIIFEGDAIYAGKVVNEINFENQPLNRFEHFIEGIRLALCSLRTSHVVYVWSKANSTTHYLARAAVTHVIDSIINMVGGNSTHYL